MVAGGDKVREREGELGSEAETGSLSDTWLSCLPLSKPDTSLIPTLLNLPPPQPPSQLAKVGQQTSLSPSQRSGTCPSPVQM